MQQVANDEGLVNVELELAVHATNGGSNVVAHDLGANHGQGLALSGVDLAGHDGRARLVLGQVELTETTSGTAAKVANVLGNLGQGTSQGVERTVSLDNGVVGSESLELVGSSDELLAGHLADLGGNGLGEAHESVDTGTDSSSSLSKLLEVRERALNTLETLVELGNVAGELLGEGQRSGILQVSASNLDDVLGLELVNLLLESVAERLDGGDQAVLDLENGSNVHDGREGVVGGGRAVDVVVGVDGLLGTHGATEDLDSSVGDDFVGVHVGLGTRASLPNDEREVVEELEVGNLFGRLLNCLANLLI